MEKNNHEYCDWTLGLYSLSGRKSYRKMSWSLKTARLDVIMIALNCDRHIGNTAAEVPVWFQRGYKCLNLAASRLHEILRYMDDSFFPQVDIDECASKSCLNDGNCTDVGWGLLKLWSLISPRGSFFFLQKYFLDYLNHIYIWQVLQQLSCGDTCQILVWF